LGRQRGKNKGIRVNAKFKEAGQEKGDPLASMEENPFQNTDGTKKGNSEQSKKATAQHEKTKEGESGKVEIGHIMGGH